VESSAPLVVSVEAGEESVGYAPFPAIAEARVKDIPCFDLARIGVPLQAVQQEESRLKFGPLRLPEPRLRFIQPPDSSLPAFERRQQIGEGSMERRQGRILRGADDEIAEELFQALLREGWLDHLGK